MKKLKEAILFFVNSINNKKLGKTKLFKLIYFADSRFYLKYGRTITGDKYVKYDNGPIPSHGDSILNKMKDKDLEIEKVKIHDKTKYKFKSLRKFNADLFTKEELEFLQEIARIFENTNTDHIVKISHRDLPWQAGKKNSYINLDLLEYQYMDIEEEPEDTVFRNSDKFKDAIGKIIQRIHMGETV